MNPSSAPLARLLAAAAELKAAGASWEQVADQVGRHPDTCRRWPARYPDDWRRLFRAAEARLVAEASGEGVLKLRQLLRSKDEKICRDVARVLVAMRERQRLTEDGAAAGDGPTAVAEAMNYAEVQALFEELRPLAPVEGAGPLEDGGREEPG